MLVELSLLCEAANPRYAYASNAALNHGCALAFNSSSSIVPVAASAILISPLQGGVKTSGSDILDSIDR